MTNLLRANMLRLVKSATFWIFFSLYVAYSIIMPFISHSWSIPEIGADIIIALGYGIYGIPIPGIIIAIICCTFFGVDYHCKTLNNQIIPGHSKSSIYIANLITASVISLAMSAVYLFFFCIVSLPLYGKIPADAKDIALLLIDGTLTMLAYSSVFTFISMISKNQLIAIIVAIMALLAMYIIVNYVCLDVLNQQPYYTGRYDRYGNWIEEIIENPYYNKTEHDVCQFIIDCFPSGQSFQLHNYNVYRWQPIPYSLGMIGATTGAGIAIFKKSNIK